MNKEELFFNQISLDFSKKYNFDLDSIAEFYDFKFKLSNLETNSLNFDESINKDKRKLTGSYYTPEYIARYMVSNALFKYFSLNAKFSKVKLEDIFFNGKTNLNKNEMLEFVEVISDLKISDLASGTGIFLLEYFKIIKDILIINKFNKSVKLLKKIIKDNIFAFDINHNALMIFSLNLNRLIFDIDSSELIRTNIYNINTIKNSNFEKLIPKNGFDIIVGNPPYLGEKGNKEVFKSIKKTDFGSKYYEGKMDLLYYFIYRGINHLNKSGVLIYLTSNYFVTADGAKKLRKFLFNNGNIIEILNFNLNKVFKSATGLHNLIFTYSKKECEETKIINLTDKIDLIDILKEKTLKKYSYRIKKDDLYGNKYLIKLFVTKMHYSIINKIERKSNLKVNDCFNVNQGLVSGADSVSKYSLNKKLSKKTIDKYRIKVSDSVFVLKGKEKDKFSGKDYLKKFYKNSDIKKFSVDLKTNKYILYIDDKVHLDLTLEEHLIPFKGILDKRREVRNGKRKWYGLQWPRNNEIFKREKIVAPQRSLSNVFGYTTEDFYGSADVYYITGKNNLYNYDLKVLLGLLNSKLYFLYISNIGKKKGKYLELYSTPIKNLLIKEISKKEEIKKYVNRLILKFNNTDYEKLNKLIYEEYNLTNDEISFIEEYYRGK